MRPIHVTLLAHTFTETSKALQVQARSAVAFKGKNSEASETHADSDYYVGAWCMVAPPAPPAQGADGAIVAACEGYAFEDADDLSVFATRDVRYAKYGQDAQGGEVAIFNKFGSRIALFENAVSITAKGGAFINLDVNTRLVSICGFPENAGEGSPYITIDSTSIGMVSATGKSSLSLSDGQITLSGQSVSVDAGSIALGKNAIFSVALAELVIKAMNTVLLAVRAHTHGGAVPTDPIPCDIPPVGSRRVKSA